MCVVGLVPDNEVRVSVKALAVSCVGAAATLLPEVFFNKLYLQPLEGQQPDGEKNTDHYPRILLIHGSIESLLFFVFFWFGLHWFILFWFGLLFVL